MKELTRWLVSVQHGNGGWRYPQGGWDCSNSQYACLALNEARECGIGVPKRTFERALRFWLDRQERDGPKVPRYEEEEGGSGVYGATRYRTRGFDRLRGWGYVDSSSPTGSMTTAGVAGAAICGRVLAGGRLSGRVERSVRDGLAWLGENFSVTENPRAGAGWHFYYLYGLERAGVLGDVVYMGKHRWYAKGARYLVDGQDNRGAFHGAGVVDHSFALLFLTRSTERIVRGTATEEPELDLSRADDLDDTGLVNLFRSAFERAMKLDDERFRRRAPDFARLGRRAIPLLLRLLDDRDEARRARAVALLRAMTGRSFAFDARMPEERRRDAVDRWTAWYLAHRSRLRFDPSAGRVRPWEE